MVAALQAVPGAETNPGLADHVLSMMDPDPSRRPMGAIAWAQQLVAGAVSTSDTQRRSAATFVTATTIQGPATPTPVPSPSPVASPAPGRRSRKLLWAAVALLVVAGVAATAVVVMGGNDESTVAPIDTASSNTTASADSTPDSSPETTSPATSTPAVAVVEVKVPSVVGKSLDEALALLSAAGLAGDVKNVEGSGPYQLVSKVSPIAGEKVEPGSSVVLTVPVPPSTMPDVTGSLLTTARRGLESYGIEVTVQEVLQEGTDQQIIDQTPTAGEPYSTAITLTVTRQPAIVYVADLEYVDGEAASRSAQVNGTVYTRSVLIYAGSGGSAVEYDLARKYLKLRGIVGPVDQVSASSTYKIEVFADGTRVFDQTLGLGQTAPFDIDVTNVLRLRLQVTLLSGPQRDYVAFADLQILGDPKVVPATTVP